MYAIVDIAGQQMKVKKDQKIFVNRIDGDQGSSVHFDKVLLIDNDKNVLIGEPVIAGAQVKARIAEHLRGDKVLVFKKKRRKGYQKLNGHRQYLTQLVIEDILEKGATAKKTETKKEPAAKKQTEEETKETVATASKEKQSTKAQKASATEKKSSTSGKSGTKKPATSKAGSTQSKGSQTKAKSTSSKKSTKASSGTASRSKSTTKKTAEKKTSENKKQSED